METPSIRQRGLTRLLVTLASAFLIAAAVEQRAARAGPIDIADFDPPSDRVLIHVAGRTFRVGSLTEQEENDGELLNKRTRGLGIDLTEIENGKTKISDRFIINPYVIHLDSVPGESDLDPDAVSLIPERRLFHPFKLELTSDANPTPEATSDTVKVFINDKLDSTFQQAENGEIFAMHTLDIPIFDLLEKTKKISDVVEIDPVVFSFESDRDPPATREFMPIPQGYRHITIPESEATPLVYELEIRNDTDIPEPSTAVLGTTFALVGLISRWWRRKRSQGSGVHRA